MAWSWEGSSRVPVLRQTALEERAAATPSEAEKVIERRSRALVKLIRGFFRL